MKSSVQFKFQLMAWLIHFAGVVFAFIALHWIQGWLTWFSNEWISGAFIVFGALYLSAVTMRIYNGVDRKSVV